MLPGRTEESVNLRIKKEGLRRAFPGTGYIVLRLETKDELGSSNII